MDARPDDELASAYLDEEATPDERARVEANPALLARVATLRAASDLLATLPPPLDPAIIDAQIAIAVAHIAVDASPATEAEVIPLRRTSWTAAPWVAAIAAVAVALVGFASFFGGAASSQFSSVGASISGAGGVAMSEDHDDPGQEMGGPIEGAPTTAPGTEATTGDLTTSSTTVPPPAPGPQPAIADSARFDIDAVAPRLKPLAPVAGDAALATSLRGLLDASGVANLAYAVDPVDPSTSTSTTIGGAPLCDRTTMRAMTVTTRIVLALLSTGRHLPMATVPTVVDGTSVDVLLLASSRDAPVTSVLLVDPSGCTSPRILSLRG